MADTNQDGLPLDKDGRPILAKEDRPRKKKRGPRTVRPTPMQIKALIYKNQGMSKYKAMLKAGYSNNLARKPNRDFYNLKGVKMMIESMASRIMDEGLTTEYMAIKFKEWMDAQKIHTSHTEPDKHVPDYDTQLKAYDRWKKIMDNEASGRPLEGGVKRKLTIEEFVTGKDGEGE